MPKDFPEKKFPEWCRPFTRANLKRPPIDLNSARIQMASTTPQEVDKRAVELVENSGGKLLGVVRNNLERVSLYYYNYTYYGYRYGYAKKKSG